MGKKDDIKLSIVEPKAPKEIANPKNEREAAASPYHREWAKAREVEMANLFGHKTFKIVDSKPTTRLLGTKFVYVVRKSFQLESFSPTHEIYRSAARPVHTEENS